MKMKMMNNVKSNIRLGNSNAKKPEGEAATSVLQVRVKPEDKETWREAAQKSNKSLAAWVITQLNKAP